MDYLFHITYFHFQVCSHYNKQSVNNVMKFFLRLENVWSSQYDIIRLEELGVMSLINSVNALLQMNNLATDKVSNLLCVLRWLILKILPLGGYLSPSTRVTPLKGNSNC